MNPVETAQAVQTSGVDPLWVAVAVVVLLMVVGVLWVFRRSDADEPDTRYQDSAYDPVAAAEAARQQAQFAESSQAETVEPEGAQGQENESADVQEEAGQAQGELQSQIKKIHESKCFKISIDIA